MALLFGRVELTGNKTVIILGRGCGFLNPISLLCLSTELSSTLWFEVGRKITQADGRYGYELLLLLVGGEFLGHTCVCCLCSGFSEAGISSP